MLCFPSSDSEWLTCYVKYDSIDCVFRLPTKTFSANKPANYISELKRLLTRLLQ